MDDKATVGRQEKSHRGDAEGAEETTWKKSTLREYHLRGSSVQDPDGLHGT